MKTRIYAAPAVKGLKGDEEVLEDDRYALKTDEVGANGKWRRVKE